MEHTLIIMMGPAGIGKSYWAKQFQKKHDDCVIVSRDHIRFSLLDTKDNYFEYEDKVEQTYYDTINNMLLTHKYVIADATQITRKSRKKLMQNLKLPSRTKRIGVWIEGPIQLAMRNNSQKTGRAYVDPNIIQQMYTYKVSPQKWEGFDEIIFISQEQNLTSSTNESGLKNNIDRLNSM